MDQKILDVQFVLTGFHGAPGYTNFYFLAGDPASEDAGATVNNAAILAARNYMHGFATYMATTWVAQLQPELKVLNDRTGELIEEYVPIGAHMAPIVGAGGSANWGPNVCGMCVTWRTVTINRSRRVRGRTFFVPLALIRWQGDGTLDNDTRTEAIAMGNSLITDTDSTFGVWSRPRARDGGKFAEVVSNSITDQAAVLRSRR